MLGLSVVIVTASLDEIPSTLHQRGIVIQVNGIMPVLPVHLLLYIQPLFSLQSGSFYET